MSAERSHSQLLTFQRDRIPSRIRKTWLADSCFTAYVIMYIRSFQQPFRSIFCKRTRIIKLVTHHTQSPQMLPARFRTYCRFILSICYLPAERYLDNRTVICKFLTCNVFKIRTWGTRSKNRSITKNAAERKMQRKRMGATQGGGGEAGRCIE